MKIYMIAPVGVRLKLSVLGLTQIINFGILKNSKTNFFAQITSTEFHNAKF